MDKLQFYITETGRTALAAATAVGDSLTISGLVLTDAETTGSLSAIENLIELSGTAVFDGTATGSVIGTGTVQLEAFDMSDSTYEAHTVALYFVDSTGQSKVFAVATSADVVVYKTEFTSASAVFVMTIDETDAMSLTFANPVLSIPPATKDALGVARLCQDGGINGSAPRPDDEPSLPTVATPYAVAQGMKTVLGENIFEGAAQIKSTLSVGTYQYTDYFQGWEAVENLSGYYDQILGADFDWRRAIGAYGTWSGGSLGSGDFKSKHYELLGEPYVMFIDTETQKNVGGIIKRSDGVWVLRAITDSEVYPVYGVWMREAGSVDVLTASAHTIEAEAVEVGASITAGGEEQRLINSSEFVTDGDGVWRMYGVQISLINGEAAHSVRLGDLSSGTIMTAAYDYASRSFIFGAGQYKLNAATGVLEYTGDAPSNVVLYHTKAASIEASHAVKAYGHDVMLARGCLGWIKFRFVSHPVDGPVIYVVDSYQMSLEVSGSSLVATLSKPASAADLRSIFRVEDTSTVVNYFEALASGEVFGSGTSARAFDVQGTDTVSFTFDTTQNFYGFIKVY